MFDEVLHDLHLISNPCIVSLGLKQTSVSSVPAGNVQRRRRVFFCGVVVSQIWMCTQFGHRTARA